MVNNMNELKCELSPNISQYLPGSAKIGCQVPSCREIFEAGSPLQIHGTITTLPADHGTKRPGHGLSTAQHSQNGKPLDQVPSCGLMGNVSYRLALTFLQTLIVFPFIAGAGKSVLWYADLNSSISHLGDLYFHPVL